MHREGTCKIEQETLNVKKLNVGKEDVKPGNTHRSTEHEAPPTTSNQSSENLGDRIPVVQTDNEDPQIKQHKQRTLDHSLQDNTQNSHTEVTFKK